MPFSIRSPRVNCPCCGTGWGYRSGGWCCVTCSAPATNLAPASSVLRASVSYSWGRLVLELSLGSVSAIAPVRWWAALRGR